MKSKLRHADSGSVSAVHVVLLLGALLMGGAAVDVSDALHAGKKLTSATDAAALAAAAELPDADAARAAALEYMAKNLAPDAAGGVAFDAEIRIGNWDGDRERFVENSGTVDAIQVVARHASNVGYASLIQSAFFWLAGSEEWMLQAEATAVKHGDCPGRTDPKMPDDCTSAGRARAILMN